MVGGGTSLLRAVLFCDGPASDVAASNIAGTIHAAIENDGGQVLDSNGSGVVAGFLDAGQAIGAGLHLANEVPGFGIGVSFGEVLADGTDWIGTTVIEAARLQQQATAGQVLVTALAADVAAGSDRSAFEDLGRRELKGLPDRVHVLLAKATVPALDPLRVVLTIDMVESTQLLARTGDEESLRLRRLFEQITMHSCDDHGGTLQDQRGDGVVLGFPSVSAAAAAANDMVGNVRKASLRADIDDGFNVRAALACQRGSQPAATANSLMDQCPPGHVLTDTTAHVYSRDRGFIFDQSEADHSILRIDSVDLPVPRALRSDGAFVGRERALEQLLDAWGRASGGDLTVAEVTGEPGMGKTRLVSQFAHVVASHGAAVLFGACDPELDIPYGPLTDALDQAAEIEADFARIIEREADLAAAPHEPDRELIFERFARVIAALTECRPVVLVLEDLHWANASTLLVLRHIVTSVPTSRLLVVGTYRPAEVGRGHPLLDLHAELLRSAASRQTVDLSPLSVAEVVELVEVQLHGSADTAATELIERVHRETSGSPFYAQELLRSLIDAEALVSSGEVVSATPRLDALPIPDTVRGVVSGRLNQLNADVYRLLSLGAVAGAEFSLDVASRALGHPFATIVDLVEAAEQVALVTEGDKPRTYAFNHAIVRSALLDDLSATRLAAAHESLALALEQMPGERTDALAHHWSRAAGPTADERAITYLGLAADRDISALAWEAAITRYRLILDRLKVPGSGASEAETLAWLGLGTAMRAVGDAEYLDAMVQAGRGARQIDRADLLARAAIGSMKPGSWFANANETNDVIIGFCEDALLGLAEDDPARVQVLSIMATSLAFESDRGRRVDLVGEAVQLARALGDPVVLASALIAEHLALWDPTTLDRRVEIADELGQIARRRDLPEVEFLAGFFRASTLLETCQVTQVREQLTQLAPLIERTGNFWFYFLVERMRIGLDIAQDVPDSHAAVDALFEESAVSQADAGGTWAAQHGGLAIHAGRMGDMADSLRSAAEGRRGQGIWSNALVIALTERGEREQAQELAQGLKKPNLDFMWLVSMQMRAEVGYGLGDKELCLDAIEELLPFRDRLGVIASGTLTYGLVATSIGEAAIGAGDYDLAIDALTQAVSKAQQIDAPFFQAKSSRLRDEAIEKQKALGLT